MTDLNLFEVTIRRKIPFLTNLFSILFLICILLAMGLTALIAPKNQNEMHSYSFLSILPNFTYTAIILLIILAFLFLLLYKKCRFYYPAALTFFLGNIHITGRSISINMLVSKIAEIYFIEPRDREGISRKKALFYFQYNGKQIRVKLDKYEDLDSFMERLLEYPNLNLKFYDWDFGVNSELEK